MIDAFLLQSWQASYMTVPARGTHGGGVPYTSGALPPLPGEEPASPPPPIPRRGDDHAPSPPQVKRNALPSTLPSKELYSH